MVHLTNDAIQKRSEDYGKFEGGNKVIRWQGFLQWISEIPFFPLFGRWFWRNSGIEDERYSLSGD